MMLHEEWYLVFEQFSYWQKKAINIKWVFKLKSKLDGSIDCHKARLVAKFYAQEKGTDFEETLPPLVI